MADATGIKTAKTSPRREMFVNGCGLLPTTCMSSGAPSPLFAVDDGAAVAVGVFPDSREVAAAKKELDGSTAWFFSLPPDDPGIFREICRQ